MSKLTMIQSFDSPMIRLEQGKRYSMTISAIIVWSDGDTRLVVDLSEIEPTTPSAPQTADKILDD